MKNVFASAFLLVIGSLFFAGIVCAYDILERLHGSQFANGWIGFFVLLNLLGYTKIAETVFSKWTIKQTRKSKIQGWKNKGD